MYDILSSRSKAKLLSMVNERLADGWKLVGGHTHVVYEEEIDSYNSEPILRTTGCWSQAMEFSIRVGTHDKYFSSKRYAFHTQFLITGEGNIFFNIDATHSQTRRKSTINTVNGILSMFFDDEDPRYEMESSWYVKKNELVRFMEIVEGISLDTDSYRLDELLDKDRGIGGWNSNSKED